MPLKDIFDDFRRSKATLEKIHGDTIQYFDEIVRKLSNPRDAAIAEELSYASSPPTSPDEVKVMARAAAMADIHLEFDSTLAELLYTTEERKEVAALFSQEPALIFKDREDVTKVEATVETGLNIEFLKSGVSIIDSPGRNENEALDNLVKEKLENPLAFDREVLSEMTSRRSDLPIFFVVSKLEPEDRTESSDDEDDEPSASAQSGKKHRETEVQSRKKQRVYEWLVKHGHLSGDTLMEQNERFHGLSAWRIQQYHEMKKTKPKAPSDAFTGYIEAFDRFQNSLKDFAEESLRTRVEHVCQNSHPPSCPDVWIFSFRRPMS
ncbi:hypothetical protein OS493_013045 [Desmophyllum pertusum]|uniref:Uncharacterized protein n=1 Tax=Desmophyllum pertusum TaxID=174260 RepID=A0A9W9Z1X5_9CNID|nr:hypothetical protein OS493_013045 [Desmophyllum pertusum]